MDPLEKEVMKGVYVTDFRDSNVREAFTEMYSGNPSLEMELQAKRNEAKALELSIEKMIESNEYMREHDPNGEDKDLVEAIEENEKIIPKRQHRLDELNKEIRVLEPLSHSNDKQCEGAR